LGGFLGKSILLLLIQLSCISQYAVFAIVIIDVVLFVLLLLELAFGLFLEKLHFVGLLLIVFLIFCVLGAFAFEFSGFFGLACFFIAAVILILIRFIYGAARLTWLLRLLKSC
jgi:hypothetical protein